MCLKSVIFVGDNFFNETQYWNTYVQKYASGEEEFLFLWNLFWEQNFC